MKKFLLILLAAILILLPSCTTIPDEPVPPVDNGNEEQNQPSDSGEDLDIDSPFIEDEGFSYPRIKPTDTELEQMKTALVENRDIPQEYKIQVNENCEIAIDDVILANDSWLHSYPWSFLTDIASTGQEYDSNVVIFDETVFFSEEEGGYVYLLLNLKRCEDSLKFSEISEASLSNGTLKITVNVIPNPYFDPNKDYEDAEPAYEERYFLKINKASLSGKIENLIVDFVYTEA